MKKKRNQSATCKSHKNRTCAIATTHCVKKRGALLLFFQASASDMLETRSAIYKMMKEEAQDERQVEELINERSDERTNK